MDLSGGFDSYRRRRDNPQSKLFRKTQQKYRKLEREVGPIRFEPHSDDTAAFRRLIEWKSDQYRRTQTGDVLQRGWTVDLLQQVLRRQHDDFAGMQSVLYVGDDVAAVQVGMRSRGVLHYWFIAHNPAYAQYSPGALLLVSIARAAATLGIRRIDLGKGDEAFKSRYTTGATGVASGAVDLRPLVRPVRRFWLRAQDWVLRSRWQTPARFVVRKTRSMLGWGTA
jgi:CelD/BcsL family acetyltransferase involved in cellulose biosynthesis